MRKVTALFIVLVYTCCSAESSPKSEEHVPNGSPKCEKITLGFCEGIPYNYTRFPNAFGHEQQIDAISQAIGRHASLIRLRCHPQLYLFVCSLYTPLCTSLETPIPPCRSLCHSVKRDCEPILNKFAFTWPEEFNCENLGGDICIGPQGLNRGISTTRPPWIPTRPPATTRIPWSRTTRPTRRPRPCRPRQTRGPRPTRRPRPNRKNRPNKPNRPNRPNRPNKPNRPNRPNKLNRPNRPNRPRPTRRPRLCYGRPPGPTRRPRPQRPSQPNTHFFWPPTPRPTGIPPNVSRPIWFTQPTPPQNVTRFPLPPLPSTLPPAVSNSTEPPRHSANDICEPLTIPMCKDLGYNQTMYPNNIGHTEQREAGLEIQQFFPLVVKVQCHADLKLFLCSLYAPYCTAHLSPAGAPTIPPIPPCRALCNRVKAGCGRLMNRFGFPWPDKLKCDLFPEQRTGTRFCVTG